ncbi:5-oxoprolinase subunit PxpB [Alteromonas sp. D210916BOD_24]|uniref:5-oxoprolinase subunit PxpB n=1 Tax=Alteromonas sp. D210916BOD_24 TaxID=3157618 RepID=UPI00399D1A2D
MQAFGNIEKIVSAGADALMLYFNGKTLDEANGACHRLLNQIDEHIKQGDSTWQWLVECVPSYDSLLIVFDMELIDKHGVYSAIRTLVDERGELNGAHLISETITTIPVWYGAPDASDLSVISEKTSLSVEEIIQLHTSMEYKVYAVGFAPGFAYMGDIPEPLSCARLGTPRKRVPKGAVAIADRQTAVYPSESPGGWHLLGLTPLNMVTHDSNRSTSLLKAGDKVKFVPISEEEFNSYHES